MASELAIEWTFNELLARHSNAERASRESSAIRTHLREHLVGRGLFRHACVDLPGGYFTAGSVRRE
jgi:hypothetical protein